MSLASAYQQLVAMNVFVVQKSSKLFLMALKAVGSWAVLSRSLTGKVFVLSCPPTRLSVPLQLWQCAAAVTKANLYVHRNKGLHDVIPVSLLRWQSGHILLFTYSFKQFFSFFFSLRLRVMSLGGCR